jgi:uncharacterized protein (TIGR02145 family)
MSSEENTKMNSKEKPAITIRGCGCLLFIFAIVSIIIAIVGGDASEGEFVDSRDGKKYRSVKIGNQTWMAENLNYAIGNSSCYENKEENCEKCGRLYDWKTAMKACSAGWHLPTDEEWINLENTAGGIEVAGGILKSKNGWSSIRDGSPGNGTDKYGFSVGSCGNGYPDGSFKYYGTGAEFWSATELADSTATIRLFSGHATTMGKYGYDKTYPKSVRCVKDN